MLDDIVTKYNNTVHRTKKMKPIDVTSDSCTEYNKDSNQKDPKFKIGDSMRISKYKNIEEVFIITKIKDTVPWTHAICDFNGEPITGTFYKNELQKSKSKRIQNRKSNYKKK